MLSHNGLGAREKAWRSTADNRKSLTTAWQWTLTGQKAWQGLAILGRSWQFLAILGHSWQVLASLDHENYVAGKLEKQSPNQCFWEPWELFGRLGKDFRSLEVTSVVFEVALGNRSGFKETRAGQGAQKLEKQSPNRYFRDFGSLRLPSK